MFAISKPFANPPAIFQSVSPPSFDSSRHRLAFPDLNSDPTGNVAPLPIDPDTDANNGLSVAAAAHIDEVIKFLVFFAEITLFEADAYRVAILDSDNNPCLLFEQSGKISLATAFANREAIIFRVHLVRRGWGG